MEARLERCRPGMAAQPPSVPLPAMPRPWFRILSFSETRCADDRQDRAGKNESSRARHGAVRAANPQGLGRPQSGNSIPRPIVPYAALAAELAPESDFSLPDDEVSAARRGEGCFRGARF